MRISTSLLPGCVAAAALLAAPSLAAADTPYTPGEYKGFNSQGGKMILRVAPGKVVRYGQQVKIKCRAGGRVVDTEGGRFTTRRAIKIGKSGRFAVNRKQGKFRVVMRGRVKGNEAKGKFQVRFKRGNQRCSSPLVSWKARWFLPL